MKLHVVLPLAILLLTVQSHAASLKTETAAAWENYLQSVNANLADRARPGGDFLWTCEDRDRMIKVHSGEIVVAPVHPQGAFRVPGGLIHHWVAAVFLPDARLENILEVTRDYDRYKYFYSPSVVASKSLPRRSSFDSFSMLFTNRGFLLNTSFEADYQVVNIRIDERRFYSISKTTRIQEIENAGLPGEQRRPEGEGSGFIWKMFNILRVQQQEGGVYVELETAALSRSIPAAVRFLVEPIVRRESRDSMLTSLQQTAAAVRVVAAGRPANSPVNAEQVSAGSTLPKDKTSAFARDH